MTATLVVGLPVSRETFTNMNGHATATAGRATTNEQRLAKPRYYQLSIMTEVRDKCFGAYNDVIRLTESCKV